MPTTDHIDREALAAAREAARRRHEEFVASGMTLDITRGKPCTAQLDLAEDMLASLQPGDHGTDAEGDLRNYGGAAKGILALREMFAPLLDVPAEQLVARDNSSLSLMHFCVASSFFHALPGGENPWAGDEVVFLAREIPQLRECGPGVHLLAGGGQLPAVPREHVQTPGHGGDETVAEAHEEHQVHGEPQDPREETGQLHLPDLHHGGEAGDRRHGTLVVVLEGLTL